MKAIPIKYVENIEYHDSPQYKAFVRMYQRFMGWFELAKAVDPPLIFKKIENRFSFWPDNVENEFYVKFHHEIWELLDEARGISKVDFKCPALKYCATFNDRTEAIQAFRFDNVYRALLRFRDVAKAPWNFRFARVPVNEVAIPRKSPKNSFHISLIPNYDGEVDIMSDCRYTLREINKKSADLFYQKKPKLTKQQNLTKYI